MIAQVEQPPPVTSVPQDEVPREMARQICKGFIAHDQGDRNSAIDSFNFVDKLQFRHVGQDRVSIASEALVEALWAKDEIEVMHVEDGSVDKASLSEADWSPVRAKFRERAAALGIKQEYASFKTEAWRQHKIDGDYWTPFQKAQVLELRCALQDSTYPEKPSDGQSGPGPEAIRYLLGVELHDMHTSTHWEQAVDAMYPYFKYILTHHNE